MKKQTVKKRIFLTNSLMIFVTLALVLLINICVMKVYWEFIEQQWEQSMTTMSGSMDIGDMMEEWTVHQQSFYVLLIADLLICGGVWILVSLFFTGRLAGQIMKPLSSLGQGVRRIRENNLTENICYQGDVEFEEICHTFNDMQAHILSEQEKNRKYEKARTEMIAGISHDLRTPLTAIRGTIKGLLDGVVKDEKQREKFLQTAYRRTGDMDILLNQLFYLSKLETGNMPLDMMQVNLQAWLNAYLEGKRSTLSEDSIKFTGNLESVSEPAFVDPEQLQRIFDNLLENSRKYGEAEPLCITLSLTETEKSFLIRFSDNGRGVPREKLPFLFDEFYRGDESRSKQEGNGLGLYIVKTLIESMGGRVWAESESGFTVAIELPKGAQENGRNEKNIDC